MRYLALTLTLAAAPASASTLVLSDYYGDMHRIDLDTLAHTTVGNFGILYDWVGLSWDPTRNAMYMVSGRGDRGLYTVNPATAAPTLIGYHGLDDVFSSAVDPTTGGIYALQANGYSGLHRLNPTTAAATYVGDPGFGVGGADFGTRGAIIANMSFTSEIFEINPTSGAARSLGDPGLSLQDNGLAVDADTDWIYLVDHSGTVWEIDPGAGFTARAIAVNLGFLNGATVVPDGQPTQRIGLRFTGACPGAVDVDVVRATPNQNVALAYGSGPGQSTIPGGPCAGITIPIQGPRLATIRRADNVGEVSLTSNLGAGVCGRPVVAVDLTTCAISLISRP